MKIFAAWLRFSRGFVARDDPSGATDTVVIFEAFIDAPDHLSRDLLIRKSAARGQ
jgi:hypothetical protein